MNVGDMIVYDGKHIAKVIRIHPGYELVGIKIYHTFGTVTKTDVSSTLCEKFKE